MKYYCPHCKSERIIEYGNYFHCLDCNSEFSKDSFGKIEDLNVLSSQELKGFIDVFEELKDPVKVKEFLKSIEEDLKDDSL